MATIVAVAAMVEVIVAALALASLAVVVAVAARVDARAAEVGRRGEGAMPRGVVAGRVARRVFGCGGWEGCPRRPCP